MKTTFIAVMAVTLVLGVAGHAQTMVEYQNLANGATKAVTTSAAPRMAQPATTAPAAPGATAGAAATKAMPPAPDPNAPQAVIWEAPTIPGKKQAPVQPTPPAVFVLSNGDRVETARYLVSVNSVRVEQNGVQRTIPLSELNVDETVATNKARGLNIKFPTDRTQIMLGF